MQIQPASIEQVSIGRTGKRVQITSDVGRVAQDLADIDPDLELHHNEDGGYFEVRCKHPVSRKSYLVCTAQELDQRIVDEIRRIRDPQYNFNEEVELIEAEYEKRQEHERMERLGEVGERLSHALRKDRNIKKHF